MNIINASFVRNGVTVRTLPVYQYNRGMILQISGLDDLPSTFRADFSNAETGQSKSVIGTDGEVHVPYEYFVPGATIHCWLVWTGADYAVTKRHIMIPIARRATPTDEEPTPDEQGVIDQAIAALNDAVAQTGQDAEATAGYAEQAGHSAQAATDAKDNAVAAQNAAEAAKDQAVQSATNAAELAQSAYQSMADAQAAAASVAGAMDSLEATIQADLQAAKESGMFDGADGVSPTVTVTPITDGHQVMITDAEGEHTFDVTDGEPGADGFSPIATVTQTQTGATISITDKVGTTTAQISNGAKGDPGDDYVLTAQDKAEIAQQAAAEVDVPVQDVQVNGTSILDAQGVANVPVANSTTLGVSMPSNNGIQTNSQGKLITKKASSNEVKTGSQDYNVITPTNQHESTFYGLAKAAGSDEKDSTLPVGTYTDEAKIAIQKMLGIYKSPWEVIRSDTITNATEGNITVTVDDNGNAFELTDIAVAFVLSAQENDTASYGEYGRVRYYYDTNSHDDTFSNAISIAVGGPKRGFYSFVEQKDNLLFKHATGQTTRGNSGTEMMVVTDAKTSNLYPLKILTEQRVYNKVEFLAVKGIADFVIYGRRKPT